MQQTKPACCVARLVQTEISTNTLAKPTSACATDKKQGVCRTNLKQTCTQPQQLTYSRKCTGRLYRHTKLYAQSRQIGLEDHSTSGPSLHTEG